MPVQRISQAIFLMNGPEKIICIGQKEPPPFMGWGGGGISPQGLPWIL